MCGISPHEHFQIQYILVQSHGSQVERTNCGLNCFTVTSQRKYLVSSVELSCPSISSRLTITVQIPKHPPPFLPFFTPTSSNLITRTCLPIKAHSKQLSASKALTTCRPSPHPATTSCRDGGRRGGAASHSATKGQGKRRLAAKFCEIRSLESGCKEDQ